MRFLLLARQICKRRRGADTWLHCRVVDFNHHLGRVLCSAIDLPHGSISLSGVGVASLPFYDFQESLGNGFPLQQFGSGEESQNISAALPHRLAGS